MLLRYLLSAACWFAIAPTLALNLDDYELVDLSHPFNEETLYWPTSPNHFDKTTLANGPTAGGWFYSAFSVCMPEHGGTHLDAPRHFSAQGDTTAAIPLQRLVTSAVVIDVSDKASANRDYRLTVADITAFETAHGPIPAGSAVLLHTGWSRFWPDAKTYLGDNTPGDASKLRFPSFGEAAVKLLVEERGVVSLGVDTASIDYGRSTDFMVHRIAAANNVVGLENLTGLAILPATGVLLFALPTKIEGGSGGPARVIALLPKSDSELSGQE